MLAFLLVRVCVRARTGLFVWVLVLSFPHNAPGLFSHLEAL